MKGLWTFTIALLVLGSALAFAEENPRFALVIGNANYDGDAALAHSVNDATDVAQVLQTVGWKVTKVLDGDRKVMNRAIATFRESLAAANNPSALLYYAGHGVQINGSNYLIPVGLTIEIADDVINDAVSLPSILQGFDDAHVAVSIVILDACRDNPFLKKTTRSTAASRGLTVVNKPSSVEGSAILFATAPGETAAFRRPATPFSSWKNRNPFPFGGQRG
jgi:uncharacterized caspase-like protein